MSRRILVTSAGSGPSNNLMRSLLRADPSTFLVGCHSDRFVLKQSPAQRKFLTHAPDSNSQDGNFGAFDQELRAVVTSAQIDLVIPGNDRDACVLAEMSERTPLGCSTFLPAARTIALCQDKYVLNMRLRDQGVPVAQTYPVTDHVSLVEAWRALAPRELAWCRIRRGVASKGATMVRDTEQAWNWISYWHTMRDVPVEDFTLSEFLPGRDYNVQGIWFDGRLVLIKMCERLSYLNADQQPSGMASTPALAKTAWMPAAIDVCVAAIHAIGGGHGVFNFDLKENEGGIPCITEINAGRFAMITNLYDLAGRHNMAATYASLACGEAVTLADPYDNPGEYYLVRELDTLPGIFDADELFEGISTT
jgi:biotin carboxylase